MALNHLLRRGHNNYTKPLSYFSRCFSSFPTSEEKDQSTPPLKPSSLSSRMSFIFDQIDKQRQEKDQSLQRIRSWHQSKSAPIHEEPPDSVEVVESELPINKAPVSDCVVSKEVELVHPWREWIELMERLVEQNYFDHKRMDEEGMMERLDLPEAMPVENEGGVQFVRDFKSVQTAMVNFGTDRFDILRSVFHWGVCYVALNVCRRCFWMGICFTS